MAEYDYLILSAPSDNYLAVPLCKALEAEGKTCLLPSRDLPESPDSSEMLSSIMAQCAECVAVVSNDFGDTPYLDDFMVESIGKELPIKIVLLENRDDATMSLQAYLFAIEPIDAVMGITDDVVHAVITGPVATEEASLPISTVEIVDVLREPYRHGWPSEILADYKYDGPVRSPFARGLRYLLGKDVPQDNDMAVKFFKQAAETAQGEDLSACAIVLAFKEPELAKEYSTPVFQTGGVRF